MTTHYKETAWWVGGLAVWRRACARASLRTGRIRYARQSEGLEDGLTFADDERIHAAARTSPAAFRHGPATARSSPRALPDPKNTVTWLVSRVRPGTTGSDGGCLCQLTDGPATAQYVQPLRVRPFPAFWFIECPAKFDASSTVIRSKLSKSHGHGLHG